jgi:hypothetical protein
MFIIMNSVKTNIKQAAFHVQFHDHQPSSASSNQTKQATWPWKLIISNNIIQTHIHHEEIGTELCLV